MFIVHKHTIKHNNIIFLTKQIINQNIQNF
jgi:hypothetical protein